MEKHWFTCDVNVLKERKSAVNTDVSVNRPDHEFGLHLAARRSRGALAYLVNIRKSLGMPEVRISGLT